MHTSNFRCGQHRWGHLVEPLWKHPELAWMPLYFCFLLAWMQSPQSCVIHFLYWSKSFVAQECFLSVIANSGIKIYIAISAAVHLHTSPIIAVGVPNCYTSLLCRKSCTNGSIMLLVCLHSTLMCNVRRNDICVHFYEKYCWCRQCSQFPATCASAKQASSGTLNITRRYHLALKHLLQELIKKFGKTGSYEHLAPPAATRNKSVRLFGAYKDN